MGQKGSLVHKIYPYTVFEWAGRQNWHFCTEWATSNSLVTYIGILFFNYEITENRDISISIVAWNVVFMKI